MPMLPIRPLMAFMLLGVLATPVQAQIVPVALDANDRDAAFIQTPNDKDQSRDLVNLISSAAAWAAATNQIRNGSGTKAAVASQQLAAEGQLSQTLRILSQYDLYVSHGVNGLSNRYETAASTVYSSGAWSQNYLRSSTPLYLDMLNNGMGIADVIAGFTAPFLKEFPSAEMSVEETDVAYSNGSLKQELYHALLQRFSKNIDNAGLSNEDARSRLLAMAKLSKPFAINGELLVNPFNKGGVANTRIFMPLAGKLMTPVKEDPQTWYYQRGFTDPLPKPVVTRFATLESMSLHAGEAGRNARGNATMVEIATQKDFHHVNKMNVNVAFGHMAQPQASNSILDIDTNDKQEALVVDGYLHLRALDGRSGSRGLQDFLHRFKIRGYMQALAFNLEREASNTYAEAFRKDAPFVPHFNVAESRIAYRVTYSLASGIGEWFTKQFLNITGFDCDDRQCTRFFKTTEELEDGFFAKLEGKLIAAITDNAFEEQLPELQDDGDKAMGDLFVNLFSQFEEQRLALKQAVSKLQEQTQRTTEN